MLLIYCAPSLAYDSCLETVKLIIRDNGSVHGAVHNRSFMRPRLRGMLRLPLDCNWRLVCKRGHTSLLVDRPFELG